MKMTKYNRREILKSKRAVIAALFVLFLVLSCAPEQKQPNILFIFSDDHAVQSIGAYGSKINKTPNIDRIANEGVIFLNNTCCNSICAPSRAAILTGKHSHANGKRTNMDFFNSDQQTFPKLLQKAGYKTALIGKWHLKSNPEGFDHWEILPGQGAYYNPDFISAQDTHLMGQYKAPHRTWAPGPDHLNMCDDVTIPEPATLFDDYSNRSSFIEDNEMSIAGHLMYDYDLKIAGSQVEDLLGRKFQNPELPRMTETQRELWDAAYNPKNEDFLQKNLTGRDLVRWKYQRYIKDYLRCVASVDDNIGRLLNYLDEIGQAENTLVIYSSDQGFYLGEHGWYDKRWMYEESLAMPLVARWPGVIKSGKRVENLTQNIDFAPTFLDVAGISIPADMHGVSLFPLFEGNDTDKWRKSIYYHYYEEGEHNVPRHEGVRTDRYKLIHFYNKQIWELYDLQMDPNEMKNVIASPGYAEIKIDLEMELKRLRQQYAVPEL